MVSRSGGANAIRIGVVGNASLAAGFKYEATGR